MFNKYGQGVFIIIKFRLQIVKYSVPERPFHRIGFHYHSIEQLMILLKINGKLVKVIRSFWHSCLMLH